MRIFVTGGTGFIGGVVVRLLRERLHEVVALVRTPAKAAALEGLGARLVAGDLGDVTRLREGMHGADAVVHGAALYRVGIPVSDRAAMVDVNVGGTERILDAAAAAEVGRILYVSTVNVFGNTHGRVVDETHRRNLSEGFLSCYDESKYRAHEVAEQRIAAGAPIVVVQPGAVYGRGDTSELGTQVRMAMRGRLPFVTFGASGIVMCHVEDVAAGVVAALDRGAVGRSYVLGGEITTLKQVMTSAAQAAGKRPPRLTMPAWAVRAGIPLAPLVTRAMGLPPNLREIVTAVDGVTYWARDDRARAELGYSPRDLGTGMRELAATPG